MQGRRGGRGAGASRALAQNINRGSLARRLRVYVLLFVVAAGGVALLRSVYSVTKSTTAPKPPPRVVSLEERSPPPPAKPELTVVEEVERIADFIQEKLGFDHHTGQANFTSATDDGYGNAAYQIVVRSPSHLPALQGSNQ